MDRRFRWLAAVGLAVALVLSLLGLRALSTAITAAHLRHVAQARLWQLQAGRPLWHWSLRRPDDVVAGRAFGPARLTAGAQGLQATSTGAAAFELGLPLTAPIDLAHWPRLNLQGATSAPTRLDLLVRPAGAGPACLASDVATLPAGIVRRTLDVRQLGWHAVGGGRCSVPAAAVMLRLRVHLPPGAHLTIDAVALWPTAPIAAPLPTVTATSEPALMRLLVAPAPGATPIVQLPPGFSAEAWLRMRDATLRHWPGALIVVGPPPVAQAETPGPAGLPWIALAVYVAGLLGLLARPPRRPGWRWVELAALLLGPLWLIAGLQRGGPHPLPATLAFAAALAYAALVARHDPKHEWYWWQGWRAAWPALLPIPVAACLVLARGHGLHLPGLRAWAVYLLWALLQQWLLLAVLLRRLERVLPWSAASVLLCALAFALLHTPNGNLMQLCLLAECWWAGYFVRRRNLLPVAIAHASCALLVQAGLVGDLLRSLKVSARFFF